MLKGDNFFDSFSTKILKYAIKSKILRVKNVGLFGLNPVGVTSVGGFLLHLQQKTAIFVLKKLLSIRFLRQIFDKIKFSIKKQAED